MKIIKNNFNSKMSSKVLAHKTKITKCEWCNSELEYEDSDLNYGSLGCGYIHCPCCGQDTYIDGEEIALTKDNIEFPKHFSKFEPKDDENTYVTDENVKEHIQKAIKYFRKNKDEYDCGYYASGTGDAYFCTKRYPGDEEYQTIVAKGYWETYIPFEKQDY